MDPTTTEFLVFLAIKVLAFSLIVGFYYQVTEEVDDDDDDFDGGILQPAYVRNN